jgi:hypothetical protein
MKISRSWLLPLLVVAGAWGCVEQGTDPPANEPFLFRVAVVDAAGNPVPNLRVSAYPPVPSGGLGKRSPSTPPAGILSATNVHFAVALVSRVNLTLLELDGTAAQHIVADRLLPGIYSVNISLRNSYGVRVYRCRFTAADTASGAILFRDSIQVVLWQPDAAVAVVGFTSAGGVVESSDSLLFPSIFNLPPFIRTDASGPTPLGTFTIPDSCTITLSDTVSGRSAVYVRRITPGRNAFTLTWNPSGVMPLMAEPGSVERPVPALFSTSPPVEWRLDQNYPNPFN